MNRIRQVVSALAAGMLLVIGVPLAVGAAPNYELYGEASEVQDGTNTVVQTISDSDTDPAYGGISFDIPSGTTFADISDLSTDFKLNANDTCTGGTPRFQINIIDPNTTQTRNIFIPLGVDSASTPCVADSWINSGDLLETGRVLDTTQLTGGAYADPYDSALSKFGTWTVTGFQLVTDGSWNAVATGGDGEQKVWFDDTVVDGQTYNYEKQAPTNKDECKNDGWKNGPFKNQGDCVSSFASKKQQNTTSSQSLLDRVRNLFR